MLFVLHLSDKSFQTGCYSKCVSSLPTSCTFGLQILLQWVCSSSSFNSIQHFCHAVSNYGLSLHCSFICSTGLSLILTDCLCCFLGRRDNIVQTFSLPASPPPMITLFLFLTPSLLFFLLPTRCLCVSCSCSSITVFECNSPDRTLV